MMRIDSNAALALAAVIRNDVEAIGFRHKFRHAYEFKLDQVKTLGLWNRWSVENASVKQSLTRFALTS